MAMEIIDAEQAHSLSLEIANLLGVVRATDSLAIMGAKEWASSESRLAELTKAKEKLLVCTAHGALGTDSTQS